MKNRGLGILLSSVVALAAPCFGELTVQVAWENGSTKLLLDSAGKALSAGVAGVAGDGVALELGYYDLATPSSPFLGKFVALAGEESADPLLANMRVGDPAGNVAGAFTVSTSFRANAAAFVGTPPPAGTPLVIRFFNAATIGAATKYNAVSGGANWQWKAPSEAPGSFVVLSLADAGLQWFGGALSSFKTLVPVTDAIRPATAGGGVTSSDSEPVEAIVGGPVNLPAQVNPAAVRYLVADLPPGLRVNTRTGAVSGVPTIPGSYRLTLTPVDAQGIYGAPVVMNITVAGLSPGVVGRFAGLVERDVALNGDLGAALQLTTTAAGSYTGKLTVGGRVISLKGRLGLDATLPEQATLSLPLSQLGAGVKLDLTLNGAARTFSGTLGTTLAHVEVTGCQTPWSRANPASARRGAYAFYLQQSKAAAEGTPEGCSFGALTVKPATGDVLVTLTLADGTRRAVGAQLGKSGEVFVYAPFASGQRGSAFGQLTIATGSPAPANNTVSGTLSWARLPGTGTVYAQGFASVDLVALGGTAPTVSAGGLVMGLAAVSDEQPQNARLSFSGGVLGEESLEFSRLVAVTNPGGQTLKNNAATAAGVPAVTLSVNPVSGAFSGAFVLAGATSDADRTARFEGQFVSVSGETRGFGYFLAPSLPAAGQSVSTSPKLSGLVLFEKR